MDVSDKNEDFYRNQIYAIAYELVYNGFKFSDNGFPISSNWKNIKVEDISIKKWIKDTHPQFTTLFRKLAK